MKTSFGQKRHAPPGAQKAIVFLSFLPDG